MCYFYVNDTMYKDWIFADIIRQLLMQLLVNLMKFILISICAGEHNVSLNYSQPWKYPMWCRVHGASNSATHSLWIIDIIRDGLLSLSDVHLRFGCLWCHHISLYLLSVLLWFYDVILIFDFDFDVIFCTSFTKTVLNKLNIYYVVTSSVVLYLFPKHFGSSIHPLLCIRALNWHKKLKHWIISLIFVLASCYFQLL